MSRRRVRLVLLCEDSQHEAFLRRFFQRAGWNRRAIRVEKSPQGRGAGEQWVRERFPDELQSIRKGHVAAMLAVMVDADRSTVKDRLVALDAACNRAGKTPRRAAEPVAVFVPRRNIETWIAYLSGRDVDETEAYPKLARERDCAEPVRILKAMCDAGELRLPGPPSLEAACTEYQTRVGTLDT
jgi:hypothetical protein